MLVPSAYLPNLAYFSAISKTDTIYIYSNEIFPKQTFRNRCFIAAANGILRLSVPVQHFTKYTTPICDIKIDQNSKWQLQHFRTLEAAYNNSPFFQFYKDDLWAIMQKKHQFLLDLNHDLLLYLLKMLGWQKTIVEKNNVEIKKLQDFELCFMEGNPHAIVYQQVFQDKLGFIPNLSIVDLLFNEGPESWRYFHLIR